MHYFHSYEKDSAGKEKDEKYVFARGIKLGDSAAKVKKKYGSAKKKNCKENSKVWNWMNCYDKMNIADLSYYYEYKLSGTKYTIRFFFNKKNKLIDVIFANNVKMVTDIVQAKEPNLQLPADTEITTSTYQGHLIYEIPRESICSSELAGEINSLYLIGKDGLPYAVNRGCYRVDYKFDNPSSEDSSGRTIMQALAYNEFPNEASGWVKYNEKKEFGWGKVLNFSKISKMVDDSDSYRFFKQINYLNNKKNGTFNCTYDIIRFRIK
ncbi:MAG: hypothetical protein E7263_08240 [Lachnospiraceae bacterium]|nr:hypothetical protein [Lachnospiraceae bacterium]